MTDRDPANSSRVIELYAGRSVAASDNGGGVDQRNREHVWAKSHGDFGTATGPGTTDYQGNRNPFVDHPEWADSIW